MSGQEVNDFLRKWGIWDDRSQEARKKRYNRFSKVRFGKQASEAAKRGYMQDLIPYEESFADSQDSIGWVE